MTFIDFSRRKSIVILLSFWSALLFSRFTVFLIEHNILHKVFHYDVIDGYHIHHFTYGIIILSVTCFIALFIPQRRERNWLFILYGLGLGLIFDEFGIWLKLDASYNQSISILASIIISILLTISAYVEHRYKVIFSLKNK